MPKDEIRDIIDSIIPPTPIFDASEDEDGSGSPSGNTAGTAGEREALLPRQEQFCRHYVTQPIATRAAVLAGYAERSAYNQGHRLLKQAEVLERIAALRAERDIRYAIRRDTMFDKLNGVFLNALGDRALAPAIAALRLQAQLAGLLRPQRHARRAAAPPRAPRRQPAHAPRMMRKSPPIAGK